MSRVVRFTVVGKPIALSRTGHGQFGGRWIAAASSKQLGKVIDAWERAGGGRFDDDEPIVLEVDFYFERPASHFGTGRNAGILKGRFIGAVPTARPDLDNLVKLVAEGLQGNAIKDDSRVVSLRASKQYARLGEHARTEVSISAFTDLANEEPLGLREEAAA
jgi:Holliday junction resolvase RusA-like endonuclease